MAQEQVLQEFKVLEAGSSYISKNSKELGRMYSKKFIAVRNGELLAVEDTFEGIMKVLAKKKIDPSYVLIEYIPGEEEIILY